MAILVVAVLIIAVVTIFSVQNASPVAVTFLFWNFQASLAIVIFSLHLSGDYRAIVFSVLRRKVLRRKGPKASPSEKALNDILTSFLQETLLEPLIHPPFSADACVNLVP